VSIPDDLAERTQHFVDDGTASSRNALIEHALVRFVQYLERQEIDLQCEAMKDDLSYRSLNERISEEFADSDWEAWVEGGERQTT
jgi:metal-responsive CopG/Arc/MetJ family transcriptional regulator